MRYAPHSCPSVDGVYPPPSQTSQRQAGSSLVVEDFGENRVNRQEEGVPKAKTEDRGVRDALVLRLFLAGVSYREIGRHPKVRLSARGVGNVVQKQLAADSSRRSLLAEEAVAVYMQRLESLLRSHWPKALAGDLKAAEYCRRVIAVEARLLGLVDAE